MDWAMSRPAFKTQLFRFVDVFPALDGARGHRPPPGRVLRRGRGPEGPRPRRRPGRQGALRRGHRGPGRAQEHRSDGRAVHRRARRRPRRSPGCTRSGAPGSAATVDLLGREDRRRPRGRPLPGPGARAPRRARAPPRRRGRPTTTSSATTSGSLPRVNVSIKPTALATHYEPLSRREGIESRQGAHPADPADGPRPRRARALRHGALRRQGPHPGAVPRPARPRTSSPTWRPAS